MLPVSGSMEVWGTTRAEPMGRLKGGEATCRTTGVHSRILWTWRVNPWTTLPICVISLLQSTRVLSLSGINTLEHVKNVILNRDRSGSFRIEVARVQYGNLNTWTARRSNLSLNFGLWMEHLIHKVGCRAIGQQCWRPRIQGRIGWLTDKLEACM